MARKEMSGMFLSQDKFDAALTEIAHGRITEVRLFHNEPSHTAHLLSALAHPQCQAHSLDLYTLDPSPDSAGAMQAYLSSPACTISTLTLHSIEGGAATAVALGAGLAAPECPVQDLSLTGLSDTELATVLQPLAQGMQHAHGTPARYVARLSLTRCHLGPAVSGCAAVLSWLQHLSITDCVLPDAVAQQLLQDGLTDRIAASQPAAAAGVQTLSLCGTQISTQTACAISMLLSQPWSQLWQLQLNNNAALGDAAVQQLAVGVQTSRRLQRLSLCQCGVGPQGAQALAAAITGHASLEELSLDHNQVGATGMLALMQAALGVGASLNLPADLQPASSKLRTLRLEANGIKGAELTAAWPQQQQQQQQTACALEHLSCAHNFLSDSGVALLQQALVHAPSFASLDLEGCGVGATGASALVQLLSGHPGMRELKLDHNRLHDAGAQLLLPAVQAHPSLQVFRAEACRLIDVSLKVRIAEVTQQLAARAAQAQQAAAAAEGHPGFTPRPTRQGTRFPASVYQRSCMDASGGPAAQGGPSMQDPAMGGVMENGVQAAKSNVRLPGGRRMGSRFGAEAYLRPMNMEEDEAEVVAAHSQPIAAEDMDHTSMPQQQGADDQHTAVSPRFSAASAGGVCGKHALEASGQEQDPRAVKAKDGDVSDAAATSPAAVNGGFYAAAGGGGGGGGGGGSGGQMSQDMMMTMPVHPFRDNMNMYGRNSYEGHQPAGNGSYYSCDGSMTSCGSSNLSLSPRWLAGAVNTTAIPSSQSEGLGRHMLTMTHSSMEGNHFLQPLMALQTCASMPLTGVMDGHHHMSSPQSAKACLVLKPSAKRRSYKPLTPQQQALFDVF